MIADPNRQILLLVAKALGDLREQVVFVGGCAAGLLITIERAQIIRPTDDVDFIVSVVSQSGYHEVENQLRAKGFKQVLEPNAPICRWQYEGVAVDVMPTDETVLGFSNQWYPMAVERAQSIQLNDDVRIQLISAPLFIATKLEAFLGRGQGDIMLSHDLEDIVNVIDGRPSLMVELKQEDASLKAYIAKQFMMLLENEEFKIALSGFLPGDAGSQARVPALIDGIKQLTLL